MATRRLEKELCRDLLASCAQKVEAVLRQKDTCVGGDVARDLRGQDRLQYRIRDGIRLTIQHLGGGVDTFLVQPYNLSKSGIGLLHGSFVYPGSICAAELSMPDNTYKWVSGVAARCHHIAGKIHDLGIKFDEELKRGWYDSAMPAVGVSYSADGELPGLSGSILLFTASKNDRDLARYALEKLKIEVTAVSNVAEAIQLAGTAKHSAVMATVWDEEDGQGFELVKALSQSKYPFPIIGLLAKGMDEACGRAMEAGCTDIIESLADFATISQLLSKYLPLSAESNHHGEPLVSTRWLDVQFRPMICQFLDNLEKAQLPAMRRAMAASAWKELRCACRDLRVTAAAYGFEPLAEAAGDLQAQSADGADAAKRETSFANLNALVRRACSSTSHDHSEAGHAQAM